MLTYFLICHFLMTGAETYTNKSPIRNALRPLEIPTYEGSGQVVHPDILFFNDGWKGWGYWMAFTPYPFEKGKYENPSVAVSQDGLSWRVPDGLENPLDSASHYVNCDPDLRNNPSTKELFLYYIDRGPRESYLKLTASKEGIVWSKPMVVFETPNFFVSPAIVIKKDKDGKDFFYMWAVRTSGWASSNSALEFMESADGYVWSEPETLSVNLPQKVIWHLDVAYIEYYQEFWALLCCYDSLSVYDFPKKVWVETNSAPDKIVPTGLYLARSKNGRSWQACSKPILMPTRDGWDSERIYRSTFLYDSLDNRIRIWYSAANRNKEWHVGYTECDFNKLAGYLGWMIDSL